MSELPPPDPRLRVYVDVGVNPVSKIQQSFSILKRHGPIQSLKYWRWILKEWLQHLLQRLIGVEELDTRKMRAFYAEIGSRVDDARTPDEVMKRVDKALDKIDDLAIRVLKLEAKD